MAQKEVPQIRIKSGDYIGVRENGEKVTDNVLAYRRTLLVKRTGTNKPYVTYVHTAPNLYRNAFGNSIAARERNILVWTGSRGRRKIVYTLKQAP